MAYWMPSVFHRSLPQFDPANTPAAKERPTGSTSVALPSTRSTGVCSAPANPVSKSAQRIASSPIFSAGLSTASRHTRSSTGQSLEVERLPRDPHGRFWLLRHCEIATQNASGHRKGESIADRSDEPISRLNVSGDQAALRRAPRAVTPAARELAVRPSPPTRRSRSRPTSTSSCRGSTRATRCRSRCTRGNGRSPP